MHATRVVHSGVRRHYGSSGRRQVLADDGAGIEERKNASNLAVDQQRLQMRTRCPADLAHDNYCFEQPLQTKIDLLNLFEKSVAPR